MAARHISNFIIVNGKPFPAPKRYPNMVVTTAVNSARNANNKVVGQKIGRDNYKIDSLEWAYLDAETWSDMLKEFKKFFVTVKFWDALNRGMPLQEAMIFAGHAKSETTMRYCTVNQEGVRYHHFKYLSA